MVMPELRRICHTCMLFAMIVLGMTSCDSFIFDDEGDCTVHYRVGFRYTKNMLGGDAFGPQVTRVHLYVFDREGQPVLCKSVDRQPTEENNFFIDLDLLPGRYDLLAWCEGQSPIEGATSFDIAGGTVPGSLAQAGAVLPLQGTAPELYSDRDITRLYHGMRTDVDFPDTYGTVDIAPIYLTRDTKHLSVLLQNMDGSPIAKDEFSFAIEDSNNALDHQNNIVSSTSFSYRPWATELTSASFDGSDMEEEHDRRSAYCSMATATLRVQDEANGLLAELTTGRLVAGRTPRLVIRNAEGEEVIRINLIQYLLMVKSHYEDARGDQDYLDRYDDHTLMFFLENGTWAKAKVYINNWRIVPPQDIEF